MFHDASATKGVLAATLVPLHLSFTVFIVQSSGAIQGSNAVWERSCLLPFGSTVAIRTKRTMLVFGVSIACFAVLSLPCAAVMTLSPYLLKISMITIYLPSEQLNLHCIALCQVFNDLLTKVSTTDSKPSSSATVRRKSKSTPKHVRPSTQPPHPLTFTNSFPQESPTQQSSA